jgi:acyl-CoA thioesterase-1
MKIVCLGDSITWGFPWGPKESWVKMLADSIDGEVINQGINGNSTSDMLMRFKSSVLKYNPTHVIIMGGINDVISGESFDRICWNINQMAEKAIENKIEVILGIPTAVDDPHWERLLVRIRKWMIELCQQKGLKYIDFSRAFYDDQGNIKTELLLPDGGHPDRAGYKALFEQIDLNIFQ